MSILREDRRRTQNPRLAPAATESVVQNLKATIERQNQTNIRQQKLITRSNRDRVSMQLALNRVASALRIAVKGTPIQGDRAKDILTMIEDTLKGLNEPVVEEAASDAEAPEADAT